MADKYFDYFTAAEAEQFSFYRIPKALFTEKDFEELSCEAKVLYGMMLDRMGLSIRNQWFDIQGRVYIIFTVEDVMGVMGCRSQKAVRLMKELDTVDGIGLIEKKRLGLGRPNLIYVKNFMVCGNSGSDSQEDVCSSSGRKETGMSYDSDDLPKEETVCVDIIEYRGPAAFEGVGCMKTVVGLENNNECQNENGRMNGEIILEYTDSSEKTINTQDENWWDRTMGVACDNKMKCGNRNVPDGLKTETVKLQTAFFGDSGIKTSVENVDNVDKYRQVGNNVDENQNSDSYAYFSEDVDVMEKEYEFPDKCFSMERIEAVPEIVGFCPVGGKTGNGRENVRVFADKEVEIMVKELLCQEEKTAVCISSEQEFPEPKEMHFEKRDSIIVNGGVPESWNAKCNDIEYSNTEYSETEYSNTEKNETDSFDAYQSYPSCQSHQSGLVGRRNGRDFDADKNREADSMEKKMDAYRETIRDNISYSCFHSQEKEDVDELVELMVDAMMVPDRNSIRIAGMEKPASVVKSRFMKLVYSHIKYVMECLDKYTGKIRNIKAYLLTTLYNSSLTISSYYRAEVNHDLYGC